jgi:hypothetical protein
MEGKVGDRLIMESERVGQPDREGEILEVRSVGSTVRYRVRWDDGHETTLTPTAGSVRIASSNGGRH